MRRVVSLHRLGVAISALVLLVLEDKLGQIGVRLGQIECPRLSGVVAAAALALKQVLFRLVEVRRVGATAFCN